MKSKSCISHEKVRKNERKKKMKKMENFSIFLWLLNFEKAFVSQYRNSDGIDNSNNSVSVFMNKINWLLEDWNYFYM